MSSPSSMFNYGKLGVCLTISALALCVTGRAVAQETASGKAQELNGTWAVDVSTSAGSGSPTFIFKQEGEKLTGKYDGMFGDASVSGTVKGNKIQFSFVIDSNGTEETIAYSGTVDGDSMKGEVKLGKDITGDFTGKRKKPAENVNVSGTWKCDVTTDAGTGSPIFVFKQEGERLTGEYQGMFGKTQFTGTVKGNVIDLSFVTDASGTEETIAYHGTVEKDSIKGEVKLGANISGTFTGQRQK